MGRTNDNSARSAFFARLTRAFGPTVTTGDDIGAPGD